MSPDVESSIVTERQRMGHCIRAHREALGLKRSEAAERIGIHAGHLARIEHGETNATLATLTAIATAYGRPLGAFFHAPPAECECA